MILPDWKIRQEIIDIGQRIYDRGLATGTDGNISYRASKDHLLITASGTCLGQLKPDDILAVDYSGNALSTERRPSSELPMHLAAYRLRPDINAVIHAHPPTATGFSIAGLSLAAPVIPEIVMTLGEIPTAPYATPSSEEGALALAELVTRHDAILLDRHGAITVGSTLEEAFYKMEKVEYTAMVTLTAWLLGKTELLSPEQVEKLWRVSPQK